MDPKLSAKFNSLYSAYTSSKLFKNHPSHQNPPKGQPQVLKIKAQALRESYVSPEDLQRMPPDVRRRYERNQREKQRSFKISKQIKDLQSVLTELHVPYKNNKCAVLTSTVSFIKEVQEENNRSVLHNEIMKKIVDSAEELARRRTEGEEKGVDGQEPTSGEVRNERTNFTSGQARNKPIDYESVFRCILVPMGIVNGTGLIVDCNESFLGVSGHQESELVGKDIRTFLKEVSPEDRQIRAETDKRLREIFGFTAAETREGGEGGDMLGGRPESYQGGDDVSPLAGKKSQIVFPIMTRKRLRTVISEDKGKDGTAAEGDDAAAPTNTAAGNTTAVNIAPTARGEGEEKEDENPIGLNFSELVKDEETNATTGEKRKRTSKLFSFSVIQLKA